MQRARYDAKYIYTYLYREHAHIHVIIDTYMYPEYDKSENCVSREYNVYMYIKYKNDKRKNIVGRRYFGRNNNDERSEPSFISALHRDARLPPREYLEIRTSASRRRTSRYPAT